MTIVVEDGTIVADANSYVTIAEADSYFELERPNAPEWSDFSDELKEQSLRFAVKVLDLECWAGYRSQPTTQELAWPRTLVYDYDRRRYFTATEIPKFLKCAQYEFAYALGKEDRTIVGEAAGGAGVKRARIDTLEVEFFGNAAQLAEKAKPLIPDIVDRLICPYLDGDCDGKFPKVLRT